MLKRFNRCVSFLSAKVVFCFITHSLRGWGGQLICPQFGFSPRYPLIIDPSGQATEFIMNEYKDRKITRTSFLDDAFRKNLESALRFGNPLLVQVCIFSSCHKHLLGFSEAPSHYSETLG